MTPIKTALSMFSSYFTKGPPASPCQCTVTALDRTQHVVIRTALCSDTLSPLPLYCGSRLWRIGLAPRLPLLLDQALVRDLTLARAKAARAEGELLHIGGGPHRRLELGRALDLAASPQPILERAAARHRPLAVARTRMTGDTSRSVPTRSTTKLRPNAVH